jgi:hypothetical protein
MIYYPIIIPTLCRYEHFKRCVESLSRCTHADKTELIIGLDYPCNESHWEGYRLLCEYIPTIKGFKNVLIFKRENNWGVDKNEVDLKNFALKHYDAVIYTEDDNEFSPCFLDFMNQALTKYKDEDNIMSISGCSPVLYYNAQETNVYCTPVTSAWGIGMWRDKESKLVKSPEFVSRGYSVLKSYSASYKLFRVSPASFRLLVRMVEKGKEWEDVMRTSYNVLYGKVQLRPTISMVRNWGCDGSGEHCGVVNSMSRQEILTMNIFKPDELNKYSLDTKLLDLIHLKDLGASKFYSFLKCIEIMCCYCRFRLMNFLKENENK